ncbi:MAG: hypothetical protein K6A77_04850 [Clostridiales bacterium]|nr:hypothetical protein [Clostridiales bacterium]
MKKGILSFLLVIMMLSMSFQPVFGAEDESADQVEEQMVEAQDETSEELSEVIEEPAGSAEEEQEEPAELAEETEEEPAEGPAEQEEEPTEQPVEEEEGSTDVETPEVQIELAAPELSSIKKTYEGVKLTWKAVEGAEKYRVLVRSGDAWEPLAVTEQTSYVDTAAESGSKMTYTVCCVSSDESAETSTYDPKGLSITYVAAPKISSISANQKTGFTISWKAVKGAAKYRLFRKSGSSWKTIGTTQETSLTHTGLSNNTTYTYTVRALDKDGKFLSAYNTKGWSAVYFDIPQLSKVASVYQGLKVSWKKVEGAAKYKIYGKKDGKWKALGTSTKTSFTDMDVTSGKTYSYTVRAMDAEGNVRSYYTSKGISGTYVAAPAITKITNNKTTGSTVTWKAITGAYQYRLYVKDGSHWKVLGTTKKTSMAHTGLKHNTTYTYTVRAVNEKGKNVSGYDPKGKTNLYLDPPSIQSIANQDGGHLLQWEDTNPYSQYRVYRKELGGSWSKAADVTGTTYLDTAFPKDKVYTYTLRCLNGSSFVSYYKNKGFGTYYKNGALASGKVTTADGAGYYFKEGRMQTGFIKSGSKTYYYSSAGVLQKNGIVGSKKEGYKYAGKDGAIDTSYTGIVKHGKEYWYCKKGAFDFTYNAAITYQKESWIIQNGIAKKATSTEDLTLWRAMKVVAKITDSSMSKAEKLKVCFKYTQTNYTEMNPRVPHYHGAGWVTLYANDMFVNGRGNCFSYAAAFGYMAKAIGYTNVYICNSGGHGWTEIDGKVYDPEWGKNHSDRTYYAMSYSTKDPDYKGAIAAGYSWMRVKI